MCLAIGQVMFITPRDISLHISYAGSQRNIVWLSMRIWHRQSTLDRCITNNIIIKIHLHTAQTLSCNNCQHKL